MNDLRGGHASEVRDAKGMLTTAIIGVVTALIVNDFLTEATDLGGLADTVLGFLVPIIAVAVLLKIMGYI